MRFYDVDFGEILLDGVNIQDYNLHDLRFAMSMVMQEPILFNYTILENILYGKPGAANSEVLTAAQVSNAIEFIEKIDEDSIAALDVASAAALVQFMKEHKDTFEANIGAKRF